MRVLKVVLSLLVVGVIAFFVVRGCVKKNEARRVAFLEGGVVQKKPPVQTIKKILPPKPPRAGGARMAIILDDWGYNYSAAKLAFGIDRPLTLSVLPHLPYSRRIAEEAHARGLGVMLHMPMEPIPPKETRLPQTILRTTPGADIERFLKEALSSVPYAEGVNNHTGSAATADPRVMKTFFKILKNRKLFFVDSEVTSKTVGPVIAKQIGIPFTKRDVFIDNELKVELIKKQLEEAKRIALKEGKVVVIGHDQKQTLQAIREVIPVFEKEGIRFVLVRDLAET